MSDNQQSRARQRLEAALKQSRASTTEPNLVDAVPAELPVPEVLIALDRIGSGHGAPMPEWYRQAARQGAGIIRAAVTSTQATIDYFSAELAKVQGARLSDPQTSKDAAKLAMPKATTQGGLLLLEYARHDRHKATGVPCSRAYGMTSEQAADLAVGVSLHSEYAKRVSDLATLGLLTPVEGATVVGRSGRERQVYAITEAGRALAAKLRGGA